MGSFEAGALRGASVPMHSCRPRWTFCLSTVNLYGLGQDCFEAAIVWQAEAVLRTPYTQTSIHNTSRT